MSYKCDIRYNFNAEKFANVMAYLSAKVPNLTKLRAAKLLFFLDKLHLIKYGRPVIGDQYYALDRGPIPSISLDIMNEVVDERPRGIPLPNRDVFLKYVSVETKGKDHPTFHKKKDYDPDIFSKSEMEVLEQVIREYGRKGIGALIEETHQDFAWQNTNRNSAIDYRDFFDNEQKSLATYQLLEEDQEDRDVVKFLSDRSPTKAHR